MKKPRKIKISFDLFNGDITFQNILDFAVDMYPSFAIYLNKIDYNKRLVTLTLY